MTDMRLHVIPLGLACCALEFHAAAVSAQLQSAWADLDGHASASDELEQCDVLVLAGTMTHALTDTITAAYQALGERRAVVSFGACSISGGPYWDSYSVANRPPVPVDISIPGCPPPPQALIDGLRQLSAIVAARSAELSPHE